MSRQLHAHIVAQLKTFASATRVQTEQYHRTSHVFYGSTAGDRHQIVDTIKKNHPLVLSQCIELLDLLYAGESFDERAVAGIILQKYSKIRKDIPYEKLDVWLDHLVGWAEIDSTCQSMFSADEVLANWENWSAFVRKLSADQNINKRRASLVLLIRPARESSDARLRELAIEVIESVRHETPIIMTKAVSWLLRGLCKHHKDFVLEYLQLHQSHIPRIAYRETMKKIETGKK